MYVVIYNINMKPKGVDTGGALGAEAPPDFQLYIIFYWEQLLTFISLNPPKL